jgi:HlyD family secretion protein
MVLWVVVAGVLTGLAVWGGVRLYRVLTASQAAVVPTTLVRRGDVTITVSARGRLQGGNSEMLSGPTSGVNELHIKFLKKDGEPSKAGDIVVEFDKTEQDYKLREAEADLAEAEAHLMQAKAESDAQQEEERYALLKAQADVRQAELDVRKNRLLSAIAARQNELALESARDQLKELQNDLANRKATNAAGIAIQEAARSKAQVQADTARKNIEAMTLRAKNAGYVAILQNTNQNMIMWGQALPIFQVGDSVRPGMAVAQIPDLKNWEASATIGELDRGHLALGQKVGISVIAMPDRQFTGSVKEVGGTTGPPWDRHFEAKIAIQNPVPELRPGMSARVTITTDVLKKVLWVPAQAVFESDGRTFAYVRSGGSFVPADIKMLRRSESQVALTGLSEGQEIALTSPDQVRNPTAAPSGAMKAIPR